MIPSGVSIEIFGLSGYQPGRIQSPVTLLSPTQLPTLQVSKHIYELLAS